MTRRGKSFRPVMSDEISPHPLAAVVLALLLAGIPLESNRPTLSLAISHPLFPIYTFPRLAFPSIPGTAAEQNLPAKVLPRWHPASCPPRRKTPSTRKPSKSSPPRSTTAAPPKVSEVDEPSRVNPSSRTFPSPRSKKHANDTSPPCNPCRPPAARHHKARCRGLSPERWSVVQKQLQEYASTRASYIEEFWDESYLQASDSVVLNLNPFSSLRMILHRRAVTSSCERPI